MLEIKNLHVKLEYEDKQILKGVDLTVEAGKVPPQRALLVPYQAALLRPSSLLRR